MAHLISISLGINLNYTNALQSSPGSAHPGVPSIPSKGIPDQAALARLKSLIKILAEVDSDSG